MGPTVTDARTYLRNIEKRIVSLERRPAVSQASDIVGPGIAARAVQINNWNEESATFNGFFYSEAAAINSPEPGYEWNGTVTARADGSGTQMLVNPEGTATHLSYVRIFRPHPDDPRVVVWGDWKQFATHSGQIGYPEIADPVVDDIEGAQQGAQDAMALAQSAANAAAAAMAFNETNFWVFRQDEAPAPGVGTAPSAFQEGWTWYDTNDNNRIRIWTNGAWAEPDYGMTAEQQARLAQAEADAAEALAQANAANSAVAAKSRTYRQAAQPSAGQNGDTWYDTDDSNRIYSHDGTTWVDSAALMVGAELRSPYNAGTGASPNVVPGMAAGPAGLALYNTLGLSVFLNAASGGASFQGSISGSDISGSTVTGGTVQSQVEASRGIKMTSSGLYGYDNAGVAAFALTAAGVLTLKGSIQSGSTIEGAILTGLLQTNAAANTGIKISDSGFYAYDQFGGLHLSVTPGALAMVGSISSSLISSSIITGGTFQTQQESNLGVKINSNGITGYSPTQGATFTLSAATGQATLTGGVMSGGDIIGATFQTGTSGSRVYISDESETAAYIRFFYGYSGEVLSNTGGVAVIYEGTPRMLVSSGLASTAGGPWDSAALIYLYPGASAATTQINLAAGNVYASTNFEVSGGNFTTNTSGVYLRNIAANSGTNYALRLQSNTWQITYTPAASSLAWKTSVEHLDDLGESVLAVQPIRFNLTEDSPEYKMSGDEGLLRQRYHGFSLEDLLLHDLEAFATINAEGDYEGIDYDRWTVAQQAALRHIDRKYQKKIDDLEARLAAAGI